MGTRRATSLVLLFAGLLVRDRSLAADPPPLQTVPVVLDTDIGDDMDDAWALVLILKNPRLDLRLVTTTNGRAEARAKLIERFLTLAGRTDVPVGLGAGSETGACRQSRWLGKGDDKPYAGRVERDGVAAMIDVVRRSPRPVTVIAIGPLQTLAAAIGRDPSLPGRAQLVAMQGSVRRGYDGSPKPTPEYNVKVDPTAARVVLGAPWRQATITPLDTCGLPGVDLDGEPFAALGRADDPLLTGLVDSYAAWLGGKRPTASTRLYDTVAVYLADPAGNPLLKFETLSIAVGKDGMTRVNPNGHPLRVATAWADLPGYRKWLADGLRATTVPKPAR